MAAAESVRREWTDLGGLTGDGLSGLVDVVTDVHRALSHRVTSMLPPGAAAVASAHWAMAGLIYAGVRAAHLVLPAAAGHAVGLASSDDAPAPSRTPTGLALLPVVNGFWGDHVAMYRPTLAVPTSVRVDDGDLVIGPETVARAFPGATGRLVVFLHGLVENDRSWWRHHRWRGDPPVLSYGDRLQTDLGLTPVYLRYNSGLRVSQTGQEVTELLARLVEAWPVEVDEIHLIGHSQGGLVARSACHYGDRDGQAWAAAVCTVITLGTPHLGAPLEQAVHVVDQVLARIPETAPLVRPLSSRSVGIKGLRFGALVEEDWQLDGPEYAMSDRCTEVPLLPHARHHVVSATLTEDAGHIVAHLFGDGLVRAPSAAGAGASRSIPFDPEHHRTFPGMHHLDLLNDPEVYLQLHEWLGREPD